ncbi:hypothetical protein T484DRAFT_1950437 [Baffinella frigidus]|nr:hypothetical protein T484DRAFT_1950437 [Cryptophyta sp. CCMP2293]
MLMLLRPAAHRRCLARVASVAMLAPRPVCYRRGSPHRRRGCSHHGACLVRNLSCEAHRF